MVAACIHCERKAIVDSMMHEWHSSETVSGLPACLQSAFHSDSWAFCYSCLYRSCEFSVDLQLQ